MCQKNFFAKQKKETTDIPSLKTLALIKHPEGTSPILD